MDICKDVDLDALKGQLKQQFHIDLPDDGYQVVANTETYLVIEILNPTKLRFAGWERRLQELTYYRSLQQAIRILDDFRGIKFLSPQDFYTAPVLRKILEFDPLLDILLPYFPEFATRIRLPEAERCVEVFIDEEAEHLSARIHVERRSEDRVFMIGSLWFYNDPVMVFRQFSRDGVDTYDRWITDHMMFDGAQNWICGYLLERPGIQDVVQIDKPLPELTFCNCELIEF